MGHRYWFVIGWVILLFVTPTAAATKAGTCCVQTLAWCPFSSPLAHFPARTKARTVASDLPGTTGLVTAGLLAGTLRVLTARRVCPLCLAGSLVAGSCSGLSIGTESIGLCLNGLYAYAGPLKELPYVSELPPVAQSQSQAQALGQNACDKSAATYGC